MVRMSDNSQGLPKKIEMTEELKNVRVPDMQSCKNMPLVECPAKHSEFCMFRIDKITSTEIDYNCPVCDKEVKRNVLTSQGWKTIVFDRQHMA